MTRSSKPQSSKKARPARARSAASYSQQPAQLLIIPEDAHAVQNLLPADELIPVIRCSRREQAFVCDRFYDSPTQTTYYVVEYCSEEDHAAVERMMIHENVFLDQVKERRLVDAGCEGSVLAQEMQRGRPAPRSIVRGS